MVFRSMTGGTGSGLSSILMQRVNDEFVRRKTVTLDILPTPQVCGVVSDLLLPPNLNYSFPNLHAGRKHLGPIQRSSSST